MKRSIVFLTALFLILTAKSSLAESNTEYTTGDYTYRILEDGTAEIVFRLLFCICLILLRWPAEAETETLSETYSDNFTWINIS